MSTYYLTSTSIQNLDGGATNYSGMVLRNTRGMGDAANLKRIEDYVNVPAADLTVGSTFRLVRIPTGAIVKKVTIYSDGPLDTNSDPTLALDFNIAFSDANTSAVGGALNDGAYGYQIDDGTPAALAGQIPTSAGTGAVTPVATYSSPNILFGTYTVQSHTVGIPWGTDITLGGVTGLASNNYTIADMQKPLWAIFGFTGGQGYAQDPGGWFDLLAYVSVGAATGTNHNLWASVDYIEA